jgi:hypothetical protein
MTGRRKNGESRRLAVAITVADADADAEVPDDKRRPSLAVARQTGALRREQKGGVRRSTEGGSGRHCAVAQLLQRGLSGQQSGRDWNWSAA